MVTITSSPLLKTYTLEEFWALPEPEDHAKLELIAGVLYMAPPPNEEHNETSDRIDAAWRREIARLGVGGKLRFPRAAIWVTPATYLEPDLHWISDATYASFQGGHPTRADVVIEIMSPATRQYDRTTKAETYAALGVPELWLVDDETKTIEVRYGDGHTFTESRVFGRGEIVGSRVLPALGVAVDDIFPP